LPAFDRAKPFAFGYAAPPAPTKSPSAVRGMVGGASIARVGPREARQPPGSEAASFSEHNRERIQAGASCRLEPHWTSFAAGRLRSHPSRRDVLRSACRELQPLGFGSGCGMMCAAGGAGAFTPARPAYQKRYMGLSSFDGLYRGQGKQAELRALLKRSQRVYTRTTTTHSLPNLG
jgi:hypothetical protein